MNDAVHDGPEPVIVCEPDVYGARDRQCVQELPRRHASYRVAVGAESVRRPEDLLDRALDWASELVTI